MLQARKLVIYHFLLNAFCLYFPFAVVWINNFSIHQTKWDIRSPSPTFQFEICEIDIKLLERWSTNTELKDL